MPLFDRPMSFYLKTAISIAVGFHCEVCEELTAMEFVCSRCMLLLPYVEDRLLPRNKLCQRFEGAIPIRRAYSLYYYRKGLGSQRIVTTIKYRKARAMGFWAGTWIADDAMQSGLFDDVDLLQPMPIHIIRHLERTYNQCDLIVRGIRSRTGIEMGNLVRRSKYTRSQTKLSVLQRRESVEGVFAGKRKNILRALDEKDRKGKKLLHIAIVDDVITTGSTVINCARAILRAVPERADEICFSVISLALSGHSPIGAVTPAKLHLPDNTVSSEDFRNLQHRPLA